MENNVERKDVLAKAKLYVTFKSGKGILHKSGCVEHVGRTMKECRRWRDGNSLSGASLV